MKVSLRITLILLLIISFSFDDSWISSATFSKSEILTNQEQVDSTAYCRTKKSFRLIHCWMLMKHKTAITETFL